MEKESRTYKSLKNAQVALIYYFVQLILSFWSRKVFFEYLGSEFVGLDTTVVSLLGFLNLAELGIGTSVSFFLYKPIFENDTESIRRIVTLQGWLYRRVAFLIVVLSCILMFFFPKFFASSTLPIGYAYAVFLVSLFGVILSYVCNYNQIILSADQKTYKVTRINQGVQAIFKIILIVLLPRVSSPITLYLAVNLLTAIVGCIVLQKVINKEYPWQKNRHYKGKLLLKEYGAIITKTKQAFVHQIGVVVLGQFSPIIMYAFTSLTVIAYYGNYLLIVNKIAQLINTVFGSTGAAVGNLVASRDKERMMQVFWELFDSRFCLAWIVLFVLYFTIEPFICIWLGKEYVLDKTVLFLLLLLYSISLTRSAVDLFKNGFGMFADIWAPLSETVINISLSVSLGYIWGIEGVLIGVIISQIIIVCIWRPYYVFKSGFHIPVARYFLPVIFRYTLIALDYILLCAFFNNQYFMNDDWQIISFMRHGIIVLSIVSVLLISEFWIFTKGFRDFTLRMISLLR